MEHEFKRQRDQPIPEDISDLWSLALAAEAAVATLATDGVQPRHTVTAVLDDVTLQDTTLAEAEHVAVERRSTIQELWLRARFSGTWDPVRSVTVWIDCGHYGRFFRIYSTSPSEAEASGWVDVIDKRVARWMADPQRLTPEQAALSVAATDPVVAKSTGSTALAVSPVVPQSLLARTWHNPYVVAIVGTIVAGLVLAYVFGVGR